MTGQQDMNDRDLLDFPGARRLKAAGKVAPPSADAVAAALAAVRSAAADRAEGDVPTVELEREPVVAVVPVRTWRRRLPVLASVAAVVAVALGVAFQPWSGSGDGHGSSPAAERAAAQERTGTAPYWKVRTSHWSRNSEKAQKDESYETVWLSRNDKRGQFGDGPVREHSELGMAGTAFWIDRNPIMWDDLNKLPTDPAALRARLLGKATGESAEEGLFNGIEELLARSPAEPRLRAALFKVLTGIPGARVTEQVKDSTGRPGTAVDLDADTWRLRLIIDPGTLHTLEAVTTARNDGLKWGTQKLRAGDLLLRTTYLSVGPAWEAPKPAPRP
ncbi:CU044_5270 family protein [Streptomyces triculaminicus]|uniref:CU044_5270 family protein n=2 Tax=Streptomyces TaxID=1883 RepID=A0A939FRD3_9ACTN|nr:MULTISPECIES: CU044_5270 family protein [Streptomyces]MBO0655474.1 CU044_5270 family protein [Streptomyces triculaminicus]QSY50691.1 CU044_5270 family protein [Streptomyces griseocarneus]